MRRGGAIATDVFGFPVALAREFVAARVDFCISRVPKVERATRINNYQQKTKDVFGAPWMGVRKCPRREKVQTPAEQAWRPTPQP